MKEGHGLVKEGRVLGNHLMDLIRENRIPEFPGWTAGHCTTLHDTADYNPVKAAHLITFTALRAGGQPALLCKISSQH